MNKSLKKIWNVISSILVALVVLLALLLVGARVVGLQVFTVLSGSMEPTYHTGSLIYVKKVDPYTIKEGQPITFMLDENTVATHRVVGIVPDEEDPTVIRFRTKGDANEAEDGSLVHYKNVIGTPIFSIPYLGYVADYIQHPPGMYIAISAGAVLLLLEYNVYTDFDRFEDNCRRMEAEANPKAQSELYQGAVELYRGDLFSKISYQHWLMPKTAYYHNIFLRINLRNIVRDDIGFCNAGKVNLISLVFVLARFLDIFLHSCWEDQFQVDTLQGIVIRVGYWII